MRLPPSDGDRNNEGSDGDSGLRREIENLKAAVREIREEVAALRRSLRAAGMHPVEVLLAQRGLPVFAHGERARVILPVNASPVQTARFYDLMRRYSFRLFLRELLQFPTGTGLGVLNRYCSEKTVRSYMAALAEMEVVRLPGGGAYELVPKHVTSLGLTLEWFVSRIFEREFLSPALFNVRLRQTAHGGDYDVIAAFADRMVYVEVKSSPPRGVELQAVSAFLDRLRDLQPHLAVFLVDTELRMRDKIVELFTEALETRHNADMNKDLPAVERLSDETFHIRRRIYMTNSRKGIYTNLRLCIRDFFHREGMAGRIPW